MVNPVFFDKASQLTWYYYFLDVKETAGPVEQAPSMFREPTQPRCKTAAGSAVLPRHNTKTVGIPHGDMKRVAVWTTPLGWTGRARGIDDIGGTIADIDRLTFFIPEGSTDLVDIDQRYPFSPNDSAKERFLVVGDD